MGVRACHVCRSRDHVDRLDCRRHGMCAAAVCGTWGRAHVGACAWRCATVWWYARRGGACGVCAGVRRVLRKWRGAPPEARTSAIAERSSTRASSEEGASGSSRSLRGSARLVLSVSETDTCHVTTRPTSGGGRVG
eukprot:4637472-Prymnesium_polylepis.1